jgi:hypothetical protein
MTHSDFKPGTSCMIDSTGNKHTNMIIDSYRVAIVLLYCQRYHFDGLVIRWQLGGGMEFGESQIAGAGMRIYSVRRPASLARGSGCFPYMNSDAVSAAVSPGQLLFVGMRFKFINSVWGSLSLHFRV